MNVQHRFLEIAAYERKILRFLMADSYINVANFSSQSF